ncbi:hypothetical protein PENTCL1PPCAC_26784, partial [Pristionchus entomophagus]
LLFLLSYSHHFTLLSSSQVVDHTMLVPLLSALPIATLIALGCAGKKNDPVAAAGGPGSAPAGSAPPAGAPAGGEKTGDNKTALDGMSQTGATGGGTQA